MNISNVSGAKVSSLLHAGAHTTSDLRFVGLVGAYAARASCALAKDGCHVGTVPERPPGLHGPSPPPALASVAGLALPREQHYQSSGPRRETRG